MSAATTCLGQEIYTLFVGFESARIKQKWVADNFGEICTTYQTAVSVATEGCFLSG